MKAYEDAPYHPIDKDCARVASFGGSLYMALSELLAATARASDDGDFCGVCGNYLPPSQKRRSGHQPGCAWIQARRIITELEGS